MKSCRSCGKKKALKSFYTHKAMDDGHLNYCKDCVKARVANHRKEHLETIRAYDRSRADEPQRKAARDARRALRLPKDAAAQAAWGRRNLHKKRAHCIARRAVLSGKLIPKLCKCGRIDVQAHHDDYSQPLEVVWLCPPCHGARHRKMNEQRRKMIPF